MIQCVGRGSVIQQNLRSASLQVILLYYRREEEISGVSVRVQAWLQLLSRLYLGLQEELQGHPGQIQHQDGGVQLSAELESDDTNR